MFSAEIQNDFIVHPMMKDMEDSREAVAARLRKVREIHGLSKKEFAERAGLTEQTYGPFENAVRDLSLNAAKLLRKTYRLSLEFMYFGITDDLPTKISKDL